MKKQYYCYFINDKKYIKCYHKLGKNNNGYFLYNKNEYIDYCDYIFNYKVVGYIIN